MGSEMCIRDRVWGVRKRTTKGISMIRFTCVEPCIHNTPIYRQTGTQTAPAPNGSVKQGTTKVLTKPNSPLFNAKGLSLARRKAAAPLGARSPHDQPMRGGPEQKGSQGARGAVIRRDGKPRDSAVPALQPAIKTGMTPSRQRWRPPKAENADRWMRRPSQRSSNQV